VVRLKGIFPASSLRPVSILLINLSLISTSVSTSVTFTTAMKFIRDIKLHEWRSPAVIYAEKEARLTGSGCQDAILSDRRVPRDYLKNFGKTTDGTSK
jgi:hypothetical protein